MSIRDATAADEAGFRRLWDAYLAFYDVTLAPAVTDQTWARILDPGSPLSARVAVDAAGKVQGFAVWHHHVASWHLANDLYLEDLFVDAAARGTGLGRALLDDLFALARACGFGRIYWHTDEGNARARSLYDSYAPADGHIRYRLKL